MPSEQGDYRERRVYKLDLVEREISECVSRLERYLIYDAVVSGVAVNNARDDYRNVSKERQIQSAFPTAWQRLLDSEDEMLLELVADSVENLCGFKPTPESVVQFLNKHCACHNPPVVQPPSTRTKQPTISGSVETLQTRNNPHDIDKSQDTPTHEYSSAGIQASAILKDKECTVLKGSHASTKIGKLTEAQIEKRSGLVSDGTLVEQDGQLVFTRNHRFNSSSLAATIIAGNSRSGPKDFKPVSGGPETQS